MGHSLIPLDKTLQAGVPSTEPQSNRQQVPAAIEGAIEETKQDEPMKIDNEMSNRTMMINFITDRPLGQEEKELIYELTRKKRQSKKSTISEKQLLAKQQLAKELKLERRDPIDIDSIRYAALNTSLNRSYSMNLDDLQDRISNSAASSFSNERESISCAKSHPKLNSISTGSCGCGGSFSGSDRSYELVGTSSTSQQQENFYIGSDELDNNSCKQQSELDFDHHQAKKEATIRLKKSRLEQLQAELETRLYQYEYLVAQEKALLGTYNMMLFTNKGVNNFHLTQDSL